ncbi:DegT/DnrJ/EryC1/StrS family aminotransferase [Sporomusa aerivorans]|uniref:DegT/DnrJ/EryC1/StrS family aminotransferase n=1 Tax=Sporomusa aerivorans TaxID=204936 RepID=UPI00352A4198
MMNFLPFALPDIGEDEINEVVDSLRSCWLTTGPKCKQFEQDFAGFLGDDLKAVAVSSATAGLHLALEAIGVGAGDEVITTPYTFTATAEVIRYLGAHPVFVDIDPQTFNIDPENIERAITSRTKAIIPVHFAGLACAMNPIITVAKKYGLKIIEDAAHSFPTSYKEKMIGTLDTDAVVFSFYATKTITAGEGGMILTRNQDIAKRCRAMRLHGINRDVFDRYTSAKPAWYYEVIAPGYKYNLTDLAASIGIHQLKKAWLFQKRRQEMARIYDQELSDLPLKLPPKPSAGDIHSWHLYVLRLNEGISDRDSFIQQMAKKGIGCSVHFIPLHIQPYWAEMYNLRPEDFPKAYATYLSAVSLPIYTKMSEEDQYRVIKSVREVLGCS